MINPFKSLCRWILRGEITSLKDKLKSETELSFRLASRLEPYTPEMVDDGETDNTTIIEFKMDVASGLKSPLEIPTGCFLVGSTIEEKGNAKFVIDKG